MDTAPTPADKLRTVTWIVYGFWAAGILSNVIHILGILPLVGLIIALIKRDEAKGTIYESHLQWVIRTFVMVLIGAVAAMILMIIPPVGMAAVVALSLWALWRMIKGGLRLYEGKPIENPQAFI